MDICFGVYVVWEYISYSAWIYVSVYMSCGNTYHIVYGYVSVYMSCGNTYHIVHGYMFRCICRVGIHII